MISANDLRELSFNETENGYSIEDVNTAINNAASTIEAYENENKDLYHKLEVLAAKIEEYRAEEDSIKTALITAQKMADRIKKESNEEAEKLVADSKVKAEASVKDASEKAEKIVSEARDYAAALIKQKNEEAERIVADAEKKSNEAINSSQIVAQNILDQAKEISDELVKKSQEEKEAYEVLNSTLRRNAASFIDSLKMLYGEQLDALNAAKLYSNEAAEETKNLESVHNDVEALVGEIDEMKSSIPTEVKIEQPAYAEPEPVEAPVEEPAAEPEEPEEEATDEEVDEIIEEVIDDEPVAEEKIEIKDEEEAAEPELDPMAAVEAFSANEITPIDKSKASVFEITEEPAQEEKSLFDEKLPFENYFNVKTEDAHLDKTKTISLVSPEEADDDDEEPKFKGFFKKKK